jgi:hypothetical protein
VPSSKRPRSQRSPLAAALRYPVLALTYLLAVPALALLERLGLTPKLLDLAGSATQLSHPYEVRWRGFEPGASDVFVCSYFKSGTNWMLQLAYQVVHRGCGDFEHLYDVVAWPDEVKKGFAVDLFDESLAKASPTGMRVIKTHADWGRIPYSKDARYILVVRDPKDVFVSSYHFIRGAVAGPLMPSVASWYASYLSKKFAPGYWPEHAHSYWAARDLDNVYLVTFKEMKADLEGTVERVAQLLGVDLSPEEFREVCRKSHFSYMSEIGEKFAPGPLTPWSINDTPTIRRGAQGGAGELLSLEQQQRIDSEFKCALQELGSDLGSDLDWERACSSATAARPEKPD